MVYHVVCKFTCYSNVREVLNRNKDACIKLFIYILVCISKKFGHWTSGSGGKKTLKRSEQMKFNKFSNRAPFLSITFPQGLRKSKKFGHWTSGSEGKKTFKRSEQMKKKNP